MIDARYKEPIPMAFGLLSYTDTDNLGDEIQSIAVRRFLPRVDYLVDRELLLIKSGVDPERFEGLAEFAHHCTMDDFINGRSTYDLYRPPANPERHLPFRNGLIQKARDFVASA